ncbi:FeoB small GTPase domain-containing protein [Pseudalkalibacillus caeni]|uniref:Iron transporter FeoB n=1 Tax=Exobacillus caeni TaxID=2574798 RepID=A0A5R9EXC9_9BACL|nr:FeoB small GTPase domain-containing protein [Pseudalkalibacillus caeni]TLS35199.1 iron transporter FeoB [Pseudalkalibacillus caeni]
MATKQAYRIALAGNPNTGKSTLFNALTGLKQHTGNWAGKTVSMAEGIVRHKDKEYRLIDLPGTYSLFSNSTDEEVARNYIIFEKPDVTLVILDATSLERNLNLALQVLEMTPNVIVCINLIDEAKKRGIVVNEGLLMRELGVPVIKMSARNKIGFSILLDTIDRMVKGEISVRPVPFIYNEETERKLEQIEPEVRKLVGDEFPARWIALRLLDGDTSLLREIEKRMLQKEDKEWNSIEASQTNRLENF